MTHKKAIAVNAVAFLFTKHFLFFAFNMKNLIGFLLLSSLIFTGCKREYAFVQPAKVDVFEQKQRVKIVNPAVAQKSFSVENEDEISHESIRQEAKLDLPISILKTEPTQEKKPLIGGGKKKKKQVQSRQSPTFLERLFPNQQLKKTQKEPTKKKKKKPFRRYGTMIPTGFVFLGIAVLLSLININGLALLFGVAAIFFLYLGIRKLLRKKRRREIFR